MWSAIHFCLAVMRVNAHADFAWSVRRVATKSHSTHAATFIALNNDSSKVPADLANTAQHKLVGHGTSSSKTRRVSTN